jgi:ABC-2 type transport system ATP-binding protein
MGDIERLCERVLVVDHGRLVFDGTLPNLAARVALQRVLVVDLPEPTPDLHVATATISAASSTVNGSGWHSARSRPPRLASWPRLAPRQM